MSATLFPSEPSRFTMDGFEKLLVHCDNLKASDITFQTDEVIYAEIYGKLHKVTKRPLSNSEISELVNGLYGANGVSQIMSGVDIDTHYEIRPDRDSRYRYRINCTGCLVGAHTGIQITARVIPSDPPDISTMNLPVNILNAMAPEQGVVYVTGATGSGKSTLLASIIKNIAEGENSHRKILTYESPIEFVYDNIIKPNTIISQSEIPKHLPSFSAGVRNALRRKPRLILVGETRDQETANAVMEAAMTGHPVYTTLHSNGVAETVRRLVATYAGERSRIIDVIETMRLVIWQKLVPTVDGKRIALREYLIFDEFIRDILLDSNLENITATTRQLLKKYGQPMLTDAEQKYAEGIIAEREYRLIAKMSKNSDRDAKSTEVPTLDALSAKS